MASSEGKRASQEGGKIGGKWATKARPRAQKQIDQRGSAYEGLHGPNQRGDPVLGIRGHQVGVWNGPSDRETAQPEQFNILVVGVVALYARFSDLSFRALLFVPSFGEESEVAVPWRLAPV